MNFYFVFLTVKDRNDPAGIDAQLVLKQKHIGPRRFASLRRNRRVAAGKRGRLGHIQKG